MGVEPLGSAMSYQAQITPQAKPAQKATVENTDVTSQEQMNTVDASTVKVAAPERKEGQGSENTFGNGGKDQQQINHEQIKKAVEKLNKNMSHSEAVFGIHDETNRVTIKIIDKDTKEVLRELPPEKTLDMIAKVWELAGIMVDERR